MGKEDNILCTDFLIIDLEKKRYKPLHSFLFVYKIGIWKPLPNITSVAVAQINMTYNAMMSSPGGTANTVKNKHKTYCVFLRSKVSNVIVCKGELDDMRKGAKIISDFLDKPLFDYCN